VEVWGGAVVALVLIMFSLRVDGRDVR
jgi:hypothetical protein